MKSREVVSGAEKRKTDLPELALRALLAACIWVALHFLAISEAVAIVTIAAIFGPSAIHSWGRGDSD